MQRFSSLWGAYAPSRVPTGALAGRAERVMTKQAVWFADAPVFREGARHCTRGACAPRMRRRCDRRVTCAGFLFGNV
jgi:hypothetical protein